MSTVVMPGSFDPFTLGHLDLLRRTCAIADQVVVAVSHNPSKSSLLGIDERCDAIAATIDAEGLAGSARVERLPDRLLVDFCARVGAVAVVRGIRSGADMAYEEPMVRMNAHLGGIDTMLLLTDARVGHISSSLVREVARLGRDVSDMLPTASQEALARALADGEQGA